MSKILLFLWWRGNLWLIFEVKNLWSYFFPLNFRSLLLNYASGQDLLFQKMNQVKLFCSFVEPELFFIDVSTPFYRRVSFALNGFSCDKFCEQSVTRKMACVHSQRENHARETADVAQEIKQAINSSWLLVAVPVESENLLVYYFVYLNVNLGYCTSCTLDHWEIFKCYSLAEIEEAILSVNLVSLDCVFNASASIRGERDVIVSWKD